MKRLLFLALATFITVCPTYRAMAWGNTGHAVIAYYAEQLLDEDVKQKCHHYLNSTLAFQASWMDQYRSFPFVFLMNCNNDGRINEMELNNTPLMCFNKYNSVVNIICKQRGGN